MAPKGDDPPSYGVITAPPHARAHSPMRLFPTGDPPQDLEAQPQPAVPSDNREKLHWGNIDSKNWTQFVPCCACASYRLPQCCTAESLKNFARESFPCFVGPFPRTNRVSYILFPCCTGSPERRSNNIGACLGFLLVGIMMFTLVCFVAMLAYVITNAVKKG